MAVSGHFAVAAARASLVAFITLAFVLASSVGNLAIEGRNWPARVVMLVVLGGVMCSVYALAAAREHARRSSRRQDVS